MKKLAWVCVEVWRSTQHIIGHFRDDFYRPDDPTNSVKHWRKPIRHWEKLKFHQNHSAVLQHEL